MTLIFVWIAGIISGILGSMGLGGGGVLILYLTLFQNVGQLKAQGINLMFFIPCAALATVIYCFKKQIKLKSLLPFILSGIPGVLLGAYLSGAIGTEWMAKLFGGGLVILGIKEIFTKDKSRKQEKNRTKAESKKNNEKD